MEALCRAWLEIKVGWMLFSIWRFFFSRISHIWTGLLRGQISAACMSLDPACLMNGDEWMEWLLHDHIIIIPRSRGKNNILEYLARSSRTVFINKQQLDLLYGTNDFLLFCVCYCRPRITKIYYFMRCLDLVLGSKFSNEWISVENRICMTGPIEGSRLPTSLEPRVSWLL